MRLRCPCCGAAHSLDALIAHDEARAALVAAFGLGGELGRSIVRYLALHRPAQRELTMARVATLLAELIPLIEAGTICHNKRHHAAPRTRWLAAIAEVLTARDAGRLKLPLSGHGYLLAVVASLAEAAARGEKSAAEAAAERDEAAATDPQAVRAAAAAFKDPALADIDQRRERAAPAPEALKQQLAAARAALSRRSAPRRSTSA